MEIDRLYEDYCKISGPISKRAFSRDVLGMSETYASFLSSTGKRPSLYAMTRLRRKLIDVLTLRELVQSYGTDNRVDTVGDKARTVIKEIDRHLGLSE